MAKLVLKDATTFVDQFDLTTDTNSVMLDASADAQLCTTFGSDGWRARIGGLKDSSFSMAGYWDAAAGHVDAHAFDDLGSARTATTACPTGVDGDNAYIFQGIDTQYTIFGSVGSVAPFTLEQGGRDGDGIVRGRLLLPKASYAAIDDGTGQQLGTVAADQRLYTSIHAFAAGTTVDVIVESDDNSGFTTPTTRSTTTITVAGGTWVAPVSGAITDDWWRVRLASITGSFDLAVAVAIA